MPVMVYLEYLNTVNMTALQLVSFGINGSFADAAVNEDKVRTRPAAGRRHGGDIGAERGESLSLIRALGLLQAWGLLLTLTATQHKS
jgi:hypothetical protein